MAFSFFDWGGKTGESQLGKWANVLSADIIRIWSREICREVGLKQE